MKANSDGSLAGLYRDATTLSLLELIFSPARGWGHLKHLWNHQFYVFLIYCVRASSRLLRYVLGIFWTNTLLGWYLVSLKSGGQAERAGLVQPGEGCRET